jgi:hypothetical protein
VEDPIRLLKESEALAYRLYTREIRRRIGIFYLLVASYVPIVFLMEKFFDKLPVAHNDVLEMLAVSYFWFIMVVTIGFLIFRTARIEVAVTRLAYLKSFRRPRRRGKFFLLMVSIPSFLGVLAIITGIGLLNVLANLLILLFILKWLRRMQRIMKVEGRPIDEYVAAVSAVLGIIGGTFIGSLALALTAGFAFAGLHSLWRSWRWEP